MDMDTNSNGEIKRPKRPRIGNTTDGSASTDSRFEKVSYGRDTSENSSPNSDGEERSHRPYQQHQRYNRDQQNGEGGYQPRPRYNNYQQGGYQPRQYNQNGPRNYNRPQQDGAEGGYQPRQYNNQNGEGGYQPRPRYNRDQQNGEGGYQPRPRYNNYQQGGYQPRQYNQNGPRNYNRPQQDGAEGGYQPRQYNNQNGEGGYQPRPRYNRDQQNGEGGYQPRPRYNNNHRNNNRNQGGYQGGYQRNNNRYNQNGPRQQRPGKSFTPRPKRIFYDEPEVDPNSEIRLNKYIANAGICSRREADEYIQQGLIKVNGNVVTELGTKITPKDIVEYNDKVVTTERKCYVLLNKPKDCVTTADDPNGRLTVMDIVKNACEERIYPVGRLDRNTTGVLLLTNDGDLASKLTHPQYVKKKIYHVWTDRDIAEEDMQRIADGIELEDGPIHADAISYATETDRNQAGIEIHSGRNRIVRRIFESLGYHVTKLDRVYFAGLTKKNLPRGRWRYLTQEEVNFLKMGSFE